MTFYGMLRIRNEARWIADVIRAIEPLCARIFVLDDHSTDGTAEICEQFRSVHLLRSPFEGLDESRDKNWLMQELYAAVPAADQHFTRGNPESPYWAVAIDGDEILEPGGVEILRESVLGQAHVLSLPIVYLWDSPDQQRVDGVYRTFSRPSVFRLVNYAFTFQRTPWGNGANFHCSSIPQEMLHCAVPCGARLLHLGYMHREDRLRKYEWYNRIDGGNAAEDFYRHVVQGDIPEVPANARLKWAGPLELRKIESCKVAA